MKLCRQYLLHSYSWDPSAHHESLKLSLSLFLIIALCVRLNRPAVPVESGLMFESPIPWPRLSERWVPKVNVSLSDWQKPFKRWLYCSSRGSCEDPVSWWGFYSGVWDHKKGCGLCEWVQFGVLLRKVLGILKDGVFPAALNSGGNYLFIFLALLTSQDIG